ncbi:MAG TPA: tetratricopeptide repeat protein [Chloroflexia bacterium]|nr:tetratricopeptide repeat protein [Chloroflexia bacterium]
MPDQPSGTVTFLFTDIEGSTRLWEEYPAAMRGALARHDRLVRQAIEAHGGYVFKTIGDAFCAAFAQAHPAVLAAVAAQQALAGEPWGETGPLRARMALHSGVAELREGDYFGPPLNRVARLRDAGHGGQVLLSAVTRTLAQDYLPPALGLRDLGAHHLKDLAAAEQIFQVLIPDLPADFAPLRTLDTHPTNLPVQPTALLGREAEIAAACALVRRADVHLLTLTGPGGTGKTRLSLQIAATLLEEFPHGAFVVNLAPLSDSALVIPTIAQALGVAEMASQPLIARLKETLRSRQMLLVLDNFEQVPEAGPAIAELLAAAPGLKVLVTSRVILHLYGEREFPVPALDRDTAVALFVDRAQAARAGFGLTAQNAPAVAAICARLDGLPLAIELAAARSRVLTPDAILARLEHRLALLTGGAHDRPRRQQSLRAAIDWSYELLAVDEQALFRRLGVFAGGCTIEAAATVGAAGGELGLDVLDGLAGLAEKSLLRQEDTPDGEPRFYMLETIREYALEHLASGGEAPGVAAAHAAWCLALAEAAAAAWVGPAAPGWVARFEPEQDNFRAALARSQGASAPPDLGLRLAIALAPFWNLRGYFSEGRQWLSGCLAAGPQAPLALRQQAVQALGQVCWVQGDVAAAEARFAESLILARESGDPATIALALNRLGNVAFMRGDYAVAQPLWAESMDLRRALGDRALIASSLNNLGILALAQGEFSRATALLGESLAILRELGDLGGQALAVGNLASIAFQQGDYAGARPLYEECMALRRQLGDHSGIAGSLSDLGELARMEGDLARAETLLTEMLTLARAINNQIMEARARAGLGRVALGQGVYLRAGTLFRAALGYFGQRTVKPQIAVCLIGLAGVAAGLGAPERAARLAGAAAALRTALADRLPAGQAAIDAATLAPARASLPAEIWAAAEAAGAALPLEVAVTYALAD